MKTTTYLKLSACIALVAALSATALSMRQKQNHSPIVMKTPSVFPQIPYRAADTAEIRKLDSVLLTLPLDAPAMTIEGTADLHDPSNSSNDQKDTRFVFAKEGHKYFYRFGSEESINSDKIFVGINYQTKAVFTGLSKELIRINLVDRGQLQSMLREGGFYLNINREGAREIFTLSSDTNPFCRIYQLTFDKTSKSIKSVFNSIPDEKFAADRSKDRTVRINFSTITTVAVLTKYPQTKEVLDEQGKLRGRFAGFKLVKL
ncbi:hypothetical protein INP83_10940 [Mucilaginibacter sp. 21P]|uniref:hypothetical protein n=1 Tax=Mucilaginibacter sp. 21P TaxID=2778902 RepID=UPI001C59BD46|nr:hypothetical protein [Mucilaginibacter sp. 21P]QXV63633.1 hypothetical protein INP83_10940 [Mucilaginibacter sp. 21P]